MTCFLFFYVEITAREVREQAVAWLEDKVTTSLYYYLETTNIILQKNWIMLQLEDDLLEIDDVGTF